MLLRRACRSRMLCLMTKVCRGRSPNRRAESKKRQKSFVCRMGWRRAACTARLLRQQRHASVFHPAGALDDLSLSDGLATARRARRAGSRRARHQLHVRLVDPVRVHDAVLQLPGGGGAQHDHLVGALAHHLCNAPERVEIWRLNEGRVASLLGRCRTRRPWRPL